MNRRGFLRLLGGAVAAAGTNPVHFLAPKGGWRQNGDALWSRPQELAVDIEIIPSMAFLHALKRLEESTPLVRDASMYGTFYSYVGRVYRVDENSPVVYVRDIELKMDTSRLRNRVVGNTRYFYAHLVDTA